MIDLNKHVRKIVKERLLAKARELGVDESEIGYSIGGNGAFGLVVTGDNNSAVMPRWVVTVSLRHKLIGRTPVTASLPVFGPMPVDDDFRNAADQLLFGAHQAREHDFSQGSQGGNVVPFTRKK